MTLNSRVIRTISITVGVSLVVSMFGLWLILEWGMRDTLNHMMKGFQYIEEENSQRDLQRVQDAYQEMLLSTETRMFDWAKWDDCWNFAIDHNAAFIKSNMPSEVIAGMGLNHILIFDTLGTLVASTSVDPTTGVPQPLPTGLLDIDWHNSPPLSMHHTDDVYSGIIDLPEGPLLFSIRPILQSSGEGPIHGSIVFTRFLDSSLIARLSDLTHLSLWINPRTDLDSEASLKYPKWNVVNDSLMVGSLLMRNYIGKPRYELNVAIPRTVRIRSLESYQQISNATNRVNWVLMGSTLFSGFALVGLLSLFIRRFVITRIQLLATSIEQVRDTGITDSRIPQMGSDEIGVLANEFNKMLDSLALAQNSIQQQNMDRKTTMDAVPLGLINLDKHYRVVGSPSRKALEWLGEHCHATPLASLLDLDQKKTLLLEEFLEVLALDLLPNKDMHALNPIQEILIPSLDELWVRVSFYRLPAADQMQTLLENEPIHLAVLEDITETRHKRNELDAMMAENTWLRAVVADPELFLEFFRESKIALDIVETALTGSPNHSSISHAYRPVHTIQGCASGFGIQTITLAAIALEDQLSALLECFSKYQLPPRFTYENSSRKALANLKTILLHEEQRLLDVLNQQSTDWKSGPSLKLPLHRLREWSALLASGETLEVQQELENSLRMPLSQILHRTILWFPGMTLRSGKQAHLQIDGGDVLLSMDWSNILNDILVHLLRNCLAHGIENSDERVMNDKPEVGTVRIVGQQTEDHLYISVEDDGRGFHIDVETALAFGSTTKRETTELAGRGVGLPAVVTMVEDIGGKIDIKSQQGKGTQILLSFDMSPRTI